MKKTKEAWKVVRNGSVEVVTRVALLSVLALTGCGPEKSPTSEVQTTASSPSLTPPPSPAPPRPLLSSKTEERPLTPPSPLTLQILEELRPQVMSLSPASGTVSGSRTDRILNLSYDQGILKLVSERRGDVNIRNVITIPIRDSMVSVRESPGLAVVITAYRGNIVRLSNFYGSENGPPIESREFLFYPSDIEAAREIEKSLAALIAATKSEVAERPIAPYIPAPFTPVAEASRQEPDWAEGRKRGSSSTPRMFRGH